VCAFARRWEGRTVLTVVPRLVASVTDNGARLPLGRDLWAETRVVVPPDFGPGSYRNLFTGTLHTPSVSEVGTALAVGEILAEYPVALLEAGPAAPGRDATGTGA
jgi:(1->4)-alpha-D-glucan 1-alpha-D-glucosylmutase